MKYNIWNLPITTIMQKKKSGIKIIIFNTQEMCSLAGEAMFQKASVWVQVFSHTWYCPFGDNGLSSKAWSYGYGSDLRTTQGLLSLRVEKSPPVVGKGGPKVQTLGCKIKKSWGYNV